MQQPTLVSQIQKVLEADPNASNKDVEAKLGRSVKSASIAVVRKRLGIRKVPGNKKTNYSQRVREYLKEHPDASYQDVVQDVGKDIPKQSYYDARAKLGLAASSTRVGRPQTRAAKATTESDQMSTADLALQILRLAERAGGMERLRKVVDVCSQLDEV